MDPFGDRHLITHHGGKLFMGPKPDNLGYNANLYGMEQRSVFCFLPSQGDTW